MALTKTKKEVTPKYRKKSTPSMKAKKEYSKEHLEKMNKVPLSIRKRGKATK